jgi:xylan 1,4-beta-xylosidase
VNVSVDAAATGSPLQRVWPFYGYDEINYTTTTEGEALLRTLVRAHTAPVYIRSHYLFNSGDGVPALKWGSTNVYSEDSAGNAAYSWALSDGIFDTLSAAGAYPFVELGFMPEALSSHPAPYRNSSTATFDSGCFYPPTDYTKWASLIRTWASHASERYPNVEANWLWELWNEPDIPYWQGTFEEYTKLYDYTEAALHDVLPRAVLGGPAVAGVSNIFLKRFLEHCDHGTNAVSGATGTRLDLVTFHAKGGVGISDGHVQMNLGGQLRLHRVGFKAVAAFPKFKHTPIYITEADPDGCAACPVSSLPANAYRNSAAYGAYELAMMKRSLELQEQVGVTLGGVLTWAFAFPNTPYFAGYRSLTTNGIGLPVLSAFKLLGRLSGTRLPLTSTGARALDDIVGNGVSGEPELDGMATRDGDAIQVLVWNYHDDLVTSPATPVHLTIKPPGGFGPRVRVSHLRLDESHGDAYTAWVAQGRPASPTGAQVAALQKAMDPSPLTPDRTIALAADGSVELDFDLPRFGVSLITLSPTADAIDEGQSASAARAAGGCSYRADGDTGDLAAQLGLAALILAVIARRRSAAQFL